ncbi:MAG: DUF6273 domain-containing protein [Clostridia bacterium]|nr:DUF6273 domain-containing protein [Clostridia bacterium]
MRKGFTLVCALLLCVLIGLPAVMADGGPFDDTLLRGWDEDEGYQYLQFGAYHQEYADQPILWRVLTVRDGRMLLLSELILDARPFDSREEDEGRTNEWEHSELRAWLNKEFIDEAFSKMDQGLILDNGAAGKVFAPSDAEMSNPEYGFESAKYEPDPARKAAGTPYAFDRGLWRPESGSYYSSFYTRTRANNTNVFHINTAGKAGLARVERTNVGIRPALWLSVQFLPFTTGDGTLEDPFR